MYDRLKTHDPEIYNLLNEEETRQQDSIRLIPSENYVSMAVREATGSCMTNKYSEGYPGKRYYEGQQVTDKIENLAIERAKQVFGAEHACVQPYSGSVANVAVYTAFADPGDTILALSLPFGGHLTHGWKVSVTGKFFNAVHYTLEDDSDLIDYDQIEKLALECKPKVIVSGATAYSRHIDYARFNEIAKKVGAAHVCDMAHVAGLVAAGAHPNPVPHSDAVTTTTHKSLRGPRGALILCKEEHAAKINKAVFPGMQGGPHMHTISAIAVALREAATPEFKQYGQQVVKNAKRFAEKLVELGFDVVSGGTDNHLVLIDLRPKNILGKPLAKALDRAGIVTNYNTIPNDPAKPFNPSGIRMGTPAVTTRGFKEEQMEQIAEWINEITHNVENDEVIEKVHKQVKQLCDDFPVPANFVNPA
ncbi:Serine hydroxymethyltransferase 2 [Anaerohalosphaera lusitana]|uniref:Serine hydroxymethyltransferase n=1 Tax=Anaerohalosphaera lusitana TaxID=1936003 RepID=A0A1U9NHI9_9BACT|nr:serine hydroxymethyltransferase [Anaerohalosphaera lusitana]AQT67379.1 Serine hydroxymethyltransferase 2 [Anaerohalosphaera lusitana]